MKLGELHETVILIDVEFLNEKIFENLSFYQKLYPKKEFQPIDPGDLIFRFAENSRLIDEGQTVNVIFTYSLPTETLSFCSPSHLLYELDNRRLSTEKGTFLLKSFFADEGESTAEHFINVFQLVCFDKNVRKIVLVEDSPELNDELEKIEHLKEWDLFLIKNYYDSNISLPIKYVNIDYIIAYALGLNENEL